MVLYLLIKQVHNQSILRTMGGVSTDIPHSARYAPARPCLYVSYAYAYISQGAKLWITFGW